MKKILTTLFLAVILLPASYAQFTKIGAATGYNYDYHFNNEQFSDHLLTKYPFISINAIYEVNLPIHLVPRFTFYIPNVFKEDLVDFNYKYVTTGFALDVDAHYVFNSLDEMELYGLAGLNILYSHRKYEENYIGSESFVDKTSDTGLGLNIGVGGYWKVKDEFDLFFEVKGIIASQIQLVGSVGILLNMEYLWSKEKDSGY